MAKKTIEKFYSDLSGDEIGEDANTLAFAFGGTSYEIDLTDKEKTAFEKAVAPYVVVARKVNSSGRRRATKSVSTTHGYEPKVVRAWAVENKIEVPARGRIPATVVAAYEAAN